MTYNLLTNYTSFIAADSEVRNKTGKSTTVKQPLPLPDGVSDYAVGNPYATSAAPAPLKMMSRSKAAVGNASAGAAAEMQDRLEKKDRTATMPIRVADVTTSGGLTQQAVSSSVEKQLQKLKGCFPTAQTKARLTLKLTIDASGAVKSVMIAGKEIKDKTVLECLQRTVKGWTFDPSSAGRETEATIALQIG